MDDDDGLTCDDWDSWMALEQTPPATGTAAHYDTAAREYYVGKWLNDLARKPWIQRSWWRRDRLRDAYEQGYSHGMSDERFGEERPGRA